MSEEDSVMLAVDSSGVVHHVESWPVEGGGGGGGGGEGSPGGGGASGSGDLAANEFRAACTSTTHAGWAGNVWDNWSAANDEVVRHNDENFGVAYHADAYVTIRFGSNWKGPVNANGSL